MSRSNYSDDDDDSWDIIRWRGAVNSAIYGKRGQKFLRHLAGLLDAMPEKVLCSNEFIDEHGRVCALGLPLREIGITDRALLAGVLNDCYEGDTGFLQGKLNIADALIREIMWVNDQYYYSGARPNEVRRWQVVRSWVERNLATR